MANKYRSAPEVEKNRLNLLIKSIEEQMDDMAKEIAEEAEDTRPSIDL